MMLKSSRNCFLTEIPSKSMNNINYLIFHPFLQVMAYNLTMTFNSIEQSFYFSLVCQNFDSDMKQEINKQTVVTSGSYFGIGWSVLNDEKDKCV